jgi:dienelactone hydrolase
MLASAAVALILAGALPQAAAQTPALTPLSIPQTYQDQTIQLNAWLSTPPGSGPFPAVILAHGCNGVDASVKTSAWPSLNKWAAWLNQEGYAALILDSYTARGIRTICRDQGVEIARELVRKIPADTRALDIYKAADVLTRMPNISTGKFAAIGFSHGGASVLRAAATDNPLAAEGKAALDADHGTFTAFIAMYPVCGESVRSTFNVPVLILIGDADQRASPEACERLAGHPRIGGGPVTFKLYPGATHSFDVEKPDRKTKFGDTLRFSADATADARERIKAFLAQYLPKP